MSKQEMILAVEYAALVGQNLIGDDQQLYVCDFAEVFPHIQHGVILGQREALEKDETKRQFIPYVVFAKPDDGVVKFFAYRRGKGVGEARLNGNVSIGVGGHIDMADVISESSVINMMATIQNSMVRELSEEIRLENAGEQLNFGSLGVMLENSNTVGKTHVATVIMCTLPEEAKVNCAEAELETLGFMTAKELLDSGLPLENWTRILCEHFSALNGDAA